MNDKYLSSNPAIGPACGGLEVPFTYQGTRWLYVWDSETKEHGYLNLDNDIIYDDYKPQQLPVQRINDTTSKTRIAGAHPAGRSYIGRGVRA